MSNWIKLTAAKAIEGEPVYVNLEHASSVIWNEREKGSVITFIGGPLTNILVHERPDHILKAR